MRDERGVDGHANGARRIPAGGARPFADREVPIVAQGEPVHEVDPWTQLMAAMAARRAVCAPAGIDRRIMAAIGELPQR